MKLIEEEEEEGNYFSWLQQGGGGIWTLDVSIGNTKKYRLSNKALGKKKEIIDLQQYKL